MKMSDACKLLGITSDTLRNWDKMGLIHFDRTPLGDRIFREEMIPQIQQLIKERNRGKKRGG